MRRNEHPAPRGIDVMARWMIAAAGALLLSACGGDKSAMVSACVKDGTDRKVCDCVATELETKLDKDVFHAMALGAQGKDEASEKAMEGLSMEQKFSVATGAMAAAMKCGLS